MYLSGGGERKREVVKMERRLIPEHMRDSCPMRKVVCEFCEGEVKAREMNPHLKDCVEFPLPCPNGCSREGEDGVRELKRKDIPVHLDNLCPLHKVQCSYWDHGCKEEMERRHTDTHEREFLHIHFKLSMTDLQHELSIANEKIAVQESQVAILEKQIASLTTTLLSQLPTGRLEWNIEGVKQKIQNRDYIFSDPFYVGLYKCQGCINLTWGGEVGGCIYIMKGDFDDKLHWPIRYKYSFVLINQINSKDNLVKSVEATKEDLEKYPDCFKRATGGRYPGLDIFY